MTKPRKVICIPCGKLNQGEWRENISGHCFVGHCDNCGNLDLLVSTGNFKKLDVLKPEQWKTPVSTQLEAVDVGQTFATDPQPETGTILTDSFRKKFEQDVRAALQENHASLVQSQHRVYSRSQTSSQPETPVTPKRKGKPTSVLDL